MRIGSKSALHKNHIKLYYTIKVNIRQVENVYFLYTERKLWGRCCRYALIFRAEGCRIILTRRVRRED